MYHPTVPLETRHFCTRSGNFCSNDFHVSGTATNCPRVDSCVRGRSVFTEANFYLSAKPLPLCFSLPNRHGEGHNLTRTCVALPVLPKVDFPSQSALVSLESYSNCHCCGGWETVAMSFRCWNFSKLFPSQQTLPLRHWNKAHYGRAGKEIISTVQKRARSDWNKWEKCRPALIATYQCDLSDGEKTPSTQSWNAVCVALWCGVHSAMSNAKNFRRQAHRARKNVSTMPQCLRFKDYDCDNSNSNGEATSFCSPNQATKNQKSRHNISWR